jgi:hypothetical protein
MMTKYYWVFTGRLEGDGEDTVYVTSVKLTELEAETAFREYMASTYGGSSVPAGADPVAWLYDQVEVMYKLRSETSITLVP